MHLQKTPQQPANLPVALMVPSASIRLVSALTQAGVSLPFQQALFAAGVATLSDFSSLGTGNDAHDQLREFLADIGIDPAAETAPLARASLRLEISRIAGAFDTARIRKDVEVRENAQRSVSFLPRVIPEQDWKNARKTFEKVHYKLHDAIAPSKLCVERLTQMLDPEHQ